MNIYIDSPKDHFYWKRTLDVYTNIKNIQGYNSLNSMLQVSSQSLITEAKMRANTVRG